MNKNVNIAKKSFCYLLIIKRPIFLVILFFLYVIVQHTKMTVNRKIREHKNI